MLFLCFYVQPTAVWAVKAGDRERGRKWEDDRDMEGRKGSERVTDTETHRGWRKQEEKKKGGVGWKSMCLVCQACDVTFPLLNIVRMILCLRQYHTPIRGELSWVEAY